MTTQKVYGSEEIEFVIDTGFVGYLTLPPAAVAALGLPFLRRMPANLADDSTINLSVYALVIVWNGEDREVKFWRPGGDHSWVPCCWMELIYECNGSTVAS